MNINNKSLFSDTTPDRIGNCKFWFLRRSQGEIEVQAPVVQKLDSAIHRINHYPVEKYYEDRLRYTLDSDLTSG